MTIAMLDLTTEYANLKPDIDAAIGQEFAIGVGSGTSALHLSLRAAGIGPGDDVITAANTDVATTMAITQAGANVVLADVNPRTFTLTAAEIEARLTPHPSTSNPPTPTSTSASAPSR